MLSKAAIFNYLVTLDKQKENEEMAIGHEITKNIEQKLLPLDTWIFKWYFIELQGKYSKIYVSQLDAAVSKIYVTGSRKQRNIYQIASCLRRRYLQKITAIYLIDKVLGKLFQHGMINHPQCSLCVL